MAECTILTAASVAVMAEYTILTADANELRTWGMKMPPSANTTHCGTFFSNGKSITK